MMMAFGAHFFIFSSWPQQRLKINKNVSFLMILVHQSIIYYNPSMKYANASHERRGGMRKLDSPLCSSEQHFASPL